MSFVQFFRTEKLAMPPAMLFVLIALAFATGLLQRISAVTIDVGPKRVIPGTTLDEHKGFIDTSAIPHGLAQFFRTGRQGRSFQIYVNVNPGQYDIKLGFVETTFCRPGARVFHVSINNRLKLISYDPFRAAGKCGKAQIVTFADQKASVFSGGRFVIQLTAVTGLASIAYISAEIPGYRCKRPSNSGNQPAHLAHADPGKYPLHGNSYPDWRGDGFVNVWINGKASHSHYSFGQRSARIISYVWTLTESGQVISTLPVFQYSFPLGTTSLSLAVVDEVCNRHIAYTSITVTTTVKPGAYCYYYRPMFFLPAVGAVSKPTHPIFAAISKTGNFIFQKFSHYNQQFIVRCIFFVQLKTPISGGNLFVDTHGSGVARLYQDGGLVVDTATSSTSAPLTFSAGLTAFELIFARRNLAKPPVATLYMNRKVPPVLYDEDATVPIISSVSPPKSSLQGGGTVMLLGYGFYWPLKVNFGGHAVVPEWRGKLSTRVFVKTPPVRIARSVQLFMERKGTIRSNTIPFQFTNACDSIRFEQRQLVLPSGIPPSITQQTCVTLGNDGKLYIGTRQGRVHVIEYNPHNLVITSMCHSEILTDPQYKRFNGQFSPRTILGITTDPRDKTPRPYVAVSTLLGRFEINRNNPSSWSNGAIERFVPAFPATMKRDKNQCLQRDSRSIVRNLPVSEVDHALNELIFTQYGDLLISVGGNTNSGLPSQKTGGDWERYFSSAVIIARLSRGARFDGRIPYTTPKNPRTARPVAGYTDIDLFATGFRNLFSMVMLRDGRIFGVDMGANCGSGNVSTSCDQYNEQYAASRDRIFAVPGRVPVDRNAKQCVYGPGRFDKLVHVKQGKYYGHANIQRAVLLKKPGECGWVDPLRNTVPGGRSPPFNYEPPLKYVYSAKTGVREYGSNLFCGELRGDLLLSQLSEGGTWRVRKGDNGQIQDNPYEFIPKGSLRIEESIHGHLIFPRYKGTGIFVSRAIFKQRSKLFVINALPFRHGKNGGTRLRVGGWGFQKSDQVYVGAYICNTIYVSMMEIVCIVPPHRGGSLSVPVRVKQKEQESKLENAVLYMAV